ncbi:MAG: hypothetical protein PW843_21405 [Azospirillaceae bacterium]|nr:hypothetical protein [Azospirillaceae bacterium]
MTINVCETESLEDGARQLAEKEHQALRHIVGKIRKSCFIYDEDGNPLDSQIRIWGAREVQPVYDKEFNKISWKFHWHMIVYLDGYPDNLLKTELSKRWTDKRAINIACVRAKSEAGLRRSLRRLATYPAKACFTQHHSSENGTREWLPPPVVDELAQWMVSRDSQWQRFSLGNRRK